ncbi:MAG: response regulator [Phycisphaerales bacterium]|nr:response regulator [Phycisphaerales bacterium]
MSHLVIPDVSLPFDRALNLLPGACLILKPSGQVVWGNAAAATLLGFGASALRGASILHFVSAGDEPLLAARLQGGGADQTAFSCLRRAGSGEDEKLRFRLAPLPAADEQLILALVLEHDRIRPVQAELRHAQKLEIVGQLAGGIAHDFNNLITAIFGYLDIARRTLDNDHPAHTAIEGIREAAEQAAGVTRTLLTFTRKAAPERSRVNLKDLVWQSAKLLRRAMPASIQLITPADTSDPVWINADANQIQQVILNLALNARDALPRGGTIRLLADYATDRIADGEPQSVAVLTVSDTGGGIAPDVLPRIFDPFFTTKVDTGHSGLGLAIIQDIIRSHEGSIAVKTGLGQGTTFRVDFPASEPAAAPAQRESTPSTQARGELLLIVEDDPLVRQIIASQLRQFGFSVMEAGAASVAASLADQNRSLISLIICDLELPDISGDKLVEQLRTTGIVVPIILITGNIQFDLTPLERNGVTILRKPFGVARLADTVSKVLSASGRSEPAASDRSAKMPPGSSPS